MKFRPFRSMKQIYSLIHDGNPYHIETSLMDWFLYDKDLRHERVNEINGPSHFFIDSSEISSANSLKRYVV